MVGAKVQLCVRDYAAKNTDCLTPQDTGAEGFFKVPVTASTYVCLLQPYVHWYWCFRSHVLSCSFAGDTGDGVLKIIEPLTLYQTRPRERQ